MSIRNERKGSGIPAGVITRMPLYFRYLSRVAKEQEKISSQDLGKALDLTAAQIRSDLSYFGSFGQHGYGYRVDELRNEIAKILGVDELYELILVGAGNLGRAIVSYPNFQSRGFAFKAAFDISAEVVGQNLDEIIIHHISELTQYLQENRVHIAVLTTPADVSQEICDELVASGVKAICNFSPLHLNVPDGVIVEHTHLADSLLKISFKLAQSETSS